MESAVVLFRTPEKHFPAQDHNIGTLTIKRSISSHAIISEAIPMVAKKTRHSAEDLSGHVEERNGVEIFIQHRNPNVFWCPNCSSLEARLSAVEEEMLQTREEMLQARSKQKTAEQNAYLRQIALDLAALAN
eukprot:scaffold7160_cov156-Ochromonas_danica.AAC.3